MNDRELLELAAKAAGLKYIKPADSYDGSMGLAVGENPMRTRTWNPLTNDGDALRLAVRLELLVYVEACFYVTVCKEHVSCVEHIGNDGRGCLYAATRRAIVRAASELGRAL